MGKSIRGLVGRQVVRLAVAAALASAPSWAGAAGIVLAAVAPSQADGTQVQDLGRIEAFASYDAHVWREVARHARHPDLRSDSPRRWNGQVDVAFDIAADGSVKDAAVARSSHSHALDGNAMRTVQRSRFKPLPADARAGGSPRRYLVTFDYRPDSD